MSQYPYDEPPYGVPPLSHHRMPGYPPPMPHRATMKARKQTNHGCTLASRSSPSACGACACGSR
jgi:hypothetical protein